MLANLIQDIRFGVRWLRKHPSFSLLAIMTMAVGIGVNTAMFSVINAVLLEPLPYSEPERIVSMSESGDEVANRWVSYPNFVDWQTRSKSFEAMSTFRGWSVNVTGGDRPETLDTRMVSAGYFKVMGVVPLLGRDFVNDDDRPGANPVTIISYGTWQKYFGGDQNVVGRSITLDDRPYTIIGVMPQSFQHHGPPPLWLLIGPQGWNGRDVRIAGSVLARLKRGVTIEQARSEINKISQQLAQEYPVENAGANRVNVLSMLDSVTSGVQPALKILFGSVFLVLLIACANVANLLLARAASRRKEFTVRAALGASRWRLARQLLIESLILSLTGGLLGLVLSSWAMSALARVAYYTVPRLEGLHLSYKALAFNLFISSFTGIFFGIIPAARFSRTDLQETLKDSSSTTTELRGKKLRGVLVVSEVALSVALLIGAGLLVRSMVRVLTTNLGFDPHNVLTMEINVSRNRYRKREQLRSTLQDALRQVQALPGVESATLSNNLPGLSDGWQNDIWPEGVAPLKPGELINVDWSIVSADYFQTMKIPLLRGRSFTKDEDEQGKPVVVVDESLARRFWPNENPIGKHIKYDSPVWHEIVGVVPTLKAYGSASQPLIKVYTPMGLATQRNPLLSVRSRTTDAGSLSEAVARAVRSVDKDLPVNDVATFDHVLDRTVSTRRFNAWLFSLFATLALVLAAIGVYGVIAYSVAGRIHEVGIRMALGASGRDVLRLFIGQGMKLVLGGLVLGLAGAFALTRLMSTLLFGVSTNDLVTFVVVSVMLSVVGLLACYVPARRATKVDPLIALRYE
jgi:putative ABC transport system permease protein